MKKTTAKKNAAKSKTGAKFHAVPETDMMTAKNNDMKTGCCNCGPLTLTFLRIVAGFAILWHGLPKVGADFGFTLFNYGNFAGISLPVWLTSVVGVAEIVIGALLILGLWTFWAGKGLATIMTVAIFGVMLDAGLGREFFYPMLFLAVGLVLAHQGPGTWSLDGKFGCGSGCGCC
jgi:uncharacterized membrane protein YphA (DoxX/SURF4 family)